MSDLIRSYPIILLGSGRFMDYSALDLSVSGLINPSDLILPVGDRNAVLAAIDAEYQALIARVDNHIDRLVALEESLDRDLAGTLRTQSSSEDGDETVDEDDDFEIYFADAEDDDDLAADMVLELGMRRMVRFNDDVVEIGSDDTVPFDYTPFDYRMGHESDSDTDTLVPDWDDPCASPDLRFVIRSRSSDLTV